MWPKGAKNKVPLGGKYDRPGIVHEFRILLYYYIESVKENETHKIVRNLKIKMVHLILARRPILVLINKKKKHQLAILILLFR